MMGWLLIPAGDGALGASHRGKTEDHCVRVTVCVGVTARSSHKRGSRDTKIRMFITLFCGDVEILITLF
jgi:hypothetical protein